MLVVAVAEAEAEDDVITLVALDLFDALGEELRERVVVVEEVVQVGTRRRCPRAGRSRWGTQKGEPRGFSTPRCPQRFLFFIGPWGGRTRGPQQDDLPAGARH